MIKPSKTPNARALGIKTPRSGVRVPKINLSPTPNPSLANPGGGLAPSAAQVPGTFPASEFPAVGFSKKAKM